MAVVPSHAIGPAAVQFADRARHRMAVRLLPFLFILYITNYLDRTSVAYAALGMSRDLGFSDRGAGHRNGHLFHQLFGFADSRRSAGRALERAPHDLRDHDCMGIADGAHSAGAYPGAALFCAPRIRGGGGRVFPRRDRLSEPLASLMGKTESVC